MPPRPALVLLMAFAMSVPASSDVCVSDMRDNGNVVPRLVFPNWYRVRLSSFDVRLCRECAWVGEERITGLTVVNFGDLPPGGISTVYWSLHCGGVSTPLLPMTAAGMHSGDAGAHPAWTWAGGSPDLAWCPDLCGVPPCGGRFTLDLYATIASCPPQDSTLSLGLPAGPGGDPGEAGSLRDGAGCSVPVESVRGPVHRVVWADRSGPVPAGDGGTVAYTIHYGKPGAAGLGAVCILETLAPGARYMEGSAVPAPDPGWGPHEGGPAVLKWTTGPWMVTGGPTSSVTFRITPGSVEDSAGVFWPDSTCGGEERPKKGIWDR